MIPMSRFNPRDGALIGGALILTRAMPMGLKLCYSPRGFLLDYEDKEAVAQFAKGAKEYAKSQGAFAVKLDPFVLNSAVSDASLALENMFLAAASLGIGSCWINCVIDFFEGTPQGKAMRKTLGIPDGYRCIGSGIFGYPRDHPARRGGEHHAADERGA